MMDTMHNEQDLPDEEKGKLGTLLKTTIGYVDTRIDLFKLMLINKLSDTTSSILSAVLAGSLFLLAFGLLMIGFAIWIGKMLGGSEYGFLIIGALVFITGFIIYKLRHKFIEGPVINKIIKKAIK